MIFEKPDEADITEEAPHGISIIDSETEEILGFWKRQQTIPVPDEGEMITLEQYDQRETETLELSNATNYKELIVRNRKFNYQMITPESGPASSYMAVLVQLEVEET